jgi:transcriptional antiterminator NusG
LFVDLKMK